MRAILEELLWNYMTAYLLLSAWHETTLRERLYFPVNQYFCFYVFHSENLPCGGAFFKFLFFHLGWLSVSPPSGLAGLASRKHSGLISALAFVALVLKAFSMHAICAD